jgi:hypothetical protein
MGFVSAAMGLVSLFGAKKQASAAKEAAKAQAAQETRVTQEKVFQSEQEQRQLAGQTRAMQAASGVQVGKGSALDILQEQAATFERERLVMKQMGGERAQQAIQRGQNVADAAMFKGVTSALQSFGSAATATAGGMQAGQTFKQSFFGFGGG